ncbi:universal stress protein, partial [mine drainage metagenome]
MVIFSSGPRSNLSASLLGGIGDYVIKNSRATVVAITSRKNKIPYEKILLPVSESLNVRRSIYIAFLIAKISNAQVSILDLRKFDRKQTHGFKNLYDSQEEIMKEYPTVEFTKADGSSMKNLISEYTNSGNA